MITLANGEKIAYDDLILATGTGGPFPAKLPLDANKEKAIQRYEEYVKLVSVTYKVNTIYPDSLSLNLVRALLNNSVQFFSYFVAH